GHRNRKQESLNPVRCARRCRDRHEPVIRDRQRHPFVAVLDQGAVAVPVVPGTELQVWSGRPGPLPTICTTAAIFLILCRPPLHMGDVRLKSQARTRESCSLVETPREGVQGGKRSFDCAPLALPMSRCDQDDRTLHPEGQRFLSIPGLRYSQRRGSKRKVCV